MYDASEQNGVDMSNARAKTSLNIASVRDYLHNGHQAWLKKKSIVDNLTNDPVFDKSKREFLTRTELYNRALFMTNRMFELQEIHNWSNEEVALAISVLHEQLPIGLHNIAFEPVFRQLASPTLLAKYGDLIATRGIMGCYLQTELAHGTNVGGLETTATFIPETQQFEINSPTLTSTKWWIGSLGKTSTHGVVQAKLILPDGKDMGPHLFFVQLRSLDDHKLLPGIVTGDIGPKAVGGYMATDNGFGRFDNVRIPKENMLSKFAQVTEDGKYIQPPHAKLSYGGMLYIRSGMVSAAGQFIGKAATISIRYATVRRQGEKGPDGLERQVISYPSLHARLIPLLSRAYVFIQLGRTLIKAFDTMATRLSSGDTSLLAEMHATTSGLKVLVTTTGIQDIETARRSMGGHGYSAFSGVGRLYADYLPSATYEGENFVLDQQVVRSALKSFRSLFTNKDKTVPTASLLSPSSYYLRLLLDPANEPPPLTASSWQDPATSIILLEWRAALLVHEIAQTQAQPDATLNQRVSRAVAEAFVAVQVGDMIKNIPLAEKEADAVKALYHLYLLTTVESALVDLLSYGLFRSGPTGEARSRDPTRSLRLAILNLCAELLPNAIGLSDALGFSDWELDSALGVYDGKAYQALWDRAQTEPLNQTEVPEAYETSIKPILLRGQRQAAKARSKL